MKTWNRWFASSCVAFIAALAWPGAAAAEQTVSLAGEWRFEIGGLEAKGFARDLPGKIRLPGTMDDAGLGPSNTKQPTLEGPYRLYDYAGPAWYQRDIEIPAAWQGKRVTLVLERCRWVTTVWLDDKLVGTQDSLIAPHAYDFGTSIAPGKHRLTICVDNTVKLNLGKFVSALFGGTWGNMNGIVGRIELAATPPVWIDDVQVYPNIAKKTALVKVRIGNATGKDGSGTLSVGGNDELLTRWVGMLTQRDPRHLYTSASNNRQRPANRQFTVATQGRGIPGAGTMRDLRDVVASDARPMLGHEIAQWMFWPDSHEIRKWTGVMALKNFEMVRDDLEKQHLLDLEPRFVQASGRFAVRLYKEEIEVLLRTPGYGGFALLDLHDYPTQGTALIGPLDAFWESKGFIAPEAWRRFCAPTVPLLRMPKRTYVADEPFEATADLAHYGPADLANAQPIWTIKDAQGREVASGKFPSVTASTGKLTTLGAISASLAKAAAPAKLTVTVALPGTEFANDWEIWVYPANLAPQPPAGVTLCDKWEAAKTALADGKKVVFFANSANPQQSLRGGFLPVFWSPVWFPSQKPNTMGLLCDPKHPLFAQFPTDFHSDWQWYELMQRSRYFVLDDTPPAYRPTLQVIDNFSRNQKLGVVFEGRVGNGQLLACGFELPAMVKDPAARQLLASLYAYVGSPAFKPAQEFSGEMLEKLFVPKFSNKLQELGARIRADSQHADYHAANAMDGDPNTIWHTEWDEPAPKFPHELVVEFPEPVRVAGLTCLPRQGNNHNGWIKDYAIHVSADGKSWDAPVAQGAFKRDAGLHPIKFAKPVETEFVKLVAVNSFDPSKPCASLAELSVITGD